MKKIKNIAAVATLALISANLLAQPVMDIYKSPSCGCCVKWAALMEEQGFQVNIHHSDDWSSLKRDAGMPMQLQSCHTAQVQGYVIEGHVPPQEVARLLAEKPDDIAGLAVPAMPRYSPGMAPQGEAYRGFNVVKFSSQGEIGLYQAY